MEKYNILRKAELLKKLKSLHQIQRTEEHLKHHRGDANSKTQITATI